MRNLIITTIIVFIVNFILQVSFDYFLVKESGEIIVSDLVKVDSVHYSQTILISNYKEKTIKGLEFYAKKGIIDTMHTESSIIINQKSRNTFEINKLYPLTNVTLYILLKINDNRNNNISIVPLNQTEFDFQLKYFSNNKQPVYIKWMSILIYSIIIALAFGGVLYYFNNRHEEINKNLKASNKEVRNWQKQIQKTTQDTLNHTQSYTKKIENIRNSQAKIKLLLKKKAQDLDIENKFYRKLLLEITQLTQHDIDEERLKQIIRNNLQTFGASLDMESDLTTIDVIANIIKDKKEEKE